MTWNLIFSSEFQTSFFSKFDSRSNWIELLGDVFKMRHPTIILKLVKNWSEKMQTITLFPNEVIKLFNKCSVWEIVGGVIKINPNYSIFCQKSFRWEINKVHLCCRQTHQIIEIVVLCGKSTINHQTFDNAMNEWTMWNVMECAHIRFVYLICWSRTKQDHKYFLEAIRYCT